MQLTYTCNEQLIQRTARLKDFRRNKNDYFAITPPYMELREFQLRFHEES